MITFMDSRDKEEKCLDSQLWHACAGTMVKMPAVNSIVFYFPQGHAEHVCESVEFRNDIRIPSYIPCRVSGIKYMAEQVTDEVFAKIRLTPISHNEVETADDEIANNPDKYPSFAKTLTQSDANNGGGFSVPKYCADTIFPLLNYAADPPVQNLSVKDVHGKTWEFRHIFRGKPRRHLLTTGWSNFVNDKKLVAGDSIVFLRSENGDVCVGIRRAKKGIANGPETPFPCIPPIDNFAIPPIDNFAIPHGGYSALLTDDENTNSNENLMYKGKVKAESVTEAANFAASKHPFEVTFYPHASTPEFFVKASRVKAAMQIPWCSGMRFKMPFETEDSMMSWFMGTICSVQVVDPSRWPDSPWRILQVTWDEPDLLQNVKCVNPWLVELVSNMPTIHFNPYTPPLQLPQQSDFPHLPMPGFPGNHIFRPNNSFSCLPNDTPAGMQGARHAQYNLSLPDLHPDRLHSSLSHVDFPPLHHVIASPRTSNSTMIPNPSSSDNISCLLTLGSSSQTMNKSDCEKAPQFKLFGQLILTEQQISQSSSGDTGSPVRAANSSLDGNEYKKGNISEESGTTFDHCSLPDRLPCESFQSEQNVEMGRHCKVFIELEDVGRTLDLSLLESYEELYMDLSNMSGIKISEMLNHVIYRDINGATKQLGDEPFREFTKTSRRLTILTDARSDNLGVRE